MKLFLILATLIAGQSVFATDACFQAVDTYYTVEQQTSEAPWGYEGLSSINLEEAEDAIEMAYSDMNSEADIEEATALVAEANKLFYFMHWTAPGNAGTSMAIVDATTCKVIKEIGISSEE